jgi:hypothetical protein
MGLLQNQVVATGPFWPELSIKQMRTQGRGIGGSVNVVVAVLKQVS